MSGGIQVRVAGDSDGEEIARLVAAFRDHLRARSPGDAQLRAQLPRAMADPASEFALALHGGEIIGYSYVRRFESLWALGLEAHLEDLFVVGSARGRGAGRALLRAAIERARSAGARRFGLNTNEMNEAAHALYRSEGIAPDAHDLYTGGREVHWSLQLC